MKYLKAAIRRAIGKLLRLKKTPTTCPDRFLSDPYHHTWPAWLAPKASDHKIGRKSERRLLVALAEQTVNRGS